ncbi:MAG: site-2 protease family protein [Candidatus Fermentibacteraceae bacterium]|nr:site-2 protease family protein [Candidatus Fermentibacteraceae bacterium]
MLEMPLVLVMVFFSVVCHEIAHGFVAYRLGDPTASRMGRLSFNPIVHVDLFGTIILPAILLMTKSPFLFAWAKPVPVNPAYFRNPRKGMMLVAMAGPAANLAIAVVLSVVLHLSGSFLPAFLAKTFAWVSLINIMLMVFNLIPIPPLDGSRIVARFLKGRALWHYMKLERYGMFIVFGLLFLGVISTILLPAMELAVRYLDLAQYLR